MSQTPNLFLSVGKQVEDEYGRTIGKVATFVLTPSGKFDAVFVEQGDGRFSRHSVEHLRMEDDGVTLVSEMKADAGILCDHIPLIWRKDQALENLSKKKKISTELFNELHSNFDGALNQLKSEAQTLSKEIDHAIDRCTEEIKSLNYALVHLEIEHEIGKMDDKSYETAFTIVQDDLKHVHLEKSDLEVTRNKLSNTLLGDKSASIVSALGKEKEQSAKGSSSIYSTPELPEPPVVVYVKEIGKTGI